MCLPSWRQWHQTQFIILTALGTWRTCTAFPILPKPGGHGHLKAAMIAECHVRIHGVGARGVVHTPQFNGKQEGAA